MAIPVICDRCRVAGTAGTGDFTQFGDLLEFEPVQVRHRVNGWDPEARRAFIALLATTGSKRRAAMAIGRNAFGIDQLLKRKDADGFRLAYERAMALSKQNGAMKLATGVADAAARQAHMETPSRLRDYEPEPEEEYDDDQKLGMIEHLLAKWLGKVEAERTARLNGEVVAADFYLRQITMFEIAFELMTESTGRNPWEMLNQLRRDGHSLYQIAATPFSQMLDDKRRALWEAMGEPARPEHPPARYLLSRLNYSLEPQETSFGGEEGERQKAEFRRRHEEDAEAQAAWESRAQLVRGD